MDIVARQVTNGNIRLAMSLGIFGMSAVVVGTPENPWFWAFVRDVMGLPWNQAQLGYEILSVMLGLNLLTIGLLLMPKLPRWVSTGPRKRSKKEQTVAWIWILWSCKVAWFASTIWSFLRGSGVRGMNKRRSSRLDRMSSRPLCGSGSVDPRMPEPTKDFKIVPDIDDASTCAGSARSSPCSMPSKSPMSMPQDSPAMGFFLDWQPEDFNE
jgi:hypothetical protein